MKTTTAPTVRFPALPGVALAFGVALLVPTPPALSATAAVGQPAPDFTEADTAGNPIRLADFRGRHVVLEWTNPECPFVRKHYASGNMQSLQKEFGAKDVVWLTINSTRAGHSEYQPPERMEKWMTGHGGAPKAVLIDGDSSTARAYVARVTPHMFVIDPQGRLVYAGAIDDTPSANPADAKKARNYVRAALDESLAGKPVSSASTRAYGCALKY